VTYFTDLTPYTYCLAPGIEDSDHALNIGWLGRGHDFPRGEADRGLVHALLMCATRPVREKRGFHDCDLCSQTGWSGPTSMALEGRALKLGNGEIRVRAHDGRWYAAPTLIAHYVAAHNYLPPAPFVDAVLRKAASFYLLTGEQLSRLTALSIEDQLDVCVRAIEAFPTSDPAALAAVCRQLRMRDEVALFQMEEMESLPDELADACAETAAAFSLDEPVSEELRRELVRDCLIFVLERAADLGVDAAAF